MKILHRRVVTIALAAICATGGVLLFERAVWQTRINRALVEAVASRDLKAVQSLLHQGADPNARKLPDASLSTVWEDISAGALRLWRQQPSPSQDIPPTALLLAVETQNANGEANADIVKLLLDKGADPRTFSFSSENGPLFETALAWAVMHDQPQITQLLLDKGADAHGLDPNGETQLHLTVGRDALDAAGTSTLVNLLLAHGADVNAKDRAGASPLYRAAERKKSLPFINTLLTHGAAVNAQNALGKTPLMAALSDSPDIKLGKFLLAHGANPSIRDKEQQTALFKYVADNQPEDINIASALLDAGADVNESDKYGSTLLSMSEGNPKLFRLLLAHGAKIFTLQDPSGTELMLGVCSLPTWELEDCSVVKILLAKGVSINIHGEDGMTALITAVDLYTSDPNHEQGYDPDPPYHKLPLIYPRLVEFLLKHGAEVNAQDKWGRTALMLASIRVDRLLLAHGADINARDKYNRTALMLAADDESAETVRFLLNHGADVTVRDVKGHTAMDRLRKINTDPANAFINLQRKRAVMQLLKQHGAAS